MTRALVWSDDPQDNGWGCSNCPWRFPVPTLLSDPEAKRAYDRLASLKFSEHVCEPGTRHQEAVNTSTPPTFTERIRKLVKVGYKPKDAVDIVVDEVALEHRNNPDLIARARAEGQEFLRKVREGLI